MKQRFTFFLMMCMCLFEGHAQVKSAALPACGSLPTPAFASQTITVRSATTADVSVTWSNVGATNYQVFYKISGASQFSTSCTTSATNCTIGGLLLGNTYTVRVEAHRFCQLAPGENDEDVTIVTTTVTLPAPIPPAPVGLAATTITPNSISVFWSPTPGATSYRLDVSSSNVFTSGNILTDFTAATTNKLVTGLVPGTIYFFRVRAVNASGVSGNSQVFSVITLPPGPSIMFATSVTDTSFVANWSAVPSATSYRLDVSSSNVFTSGNILTDFTVTATNKLVTGLASSTTYFFRIRSVNASGVTGNSQSFSVTTLPAAPSILFPTSVTETSFVANWSAVPSALFYKLDVSLTPTFSSGNIHTDLDVLTTSLEVSGLQPNTACFFRVRTINAGGASVNSRVFPVTTMPLPPANLVLIATMTNSFTVGWSPDSAGAYFVDVSLSPVFTSGNIYTDLIACCTPVTITGLEPNTTYFFRVRAVNARLSNYSEVLSVTTTAPVPAPVITSFTPSSGPAGTSVTITGTNFNSINANNFVFFGATKARVTAATSSSLSVIAPFGATFEPISVTDITTHLTGYSASPFITTFSPAGQTLNSNSFGPKSVLRTDRITSVKTADFNGDGKPDLVVSNSDNSLLIYRNISLRGSLDSSSFILAGHLNFTPFIGAIIIEDFNGDGKPDMAARTGNNSLSILLNESSPGATTFSFARFDFDTGRQVNAFTTGDLDGDGRPDLALVHALPLVNGASVNAVTIFRNNGGNAGLFSLPGVSFPAGRSSLSIAIGDLDNDLKPEIAIGDNLTSTVSVFKNTSVKGSITPTSFAPKIDFDAVSNIADLMIGDLDGNGTQDLVVTGFDKISVFDNIGPIAFAQRRDYTVTAGGFNNLTISDLNGDAKPEIIVNGSVFQNTSVPGSGNSSFAQSINYLSGRSSFGFGTIAGDLDDDGKPDLIMAHDFDFNIEIPGGDGSEFVLLHNNLASDSIPDVFVANPANGSTGFLPTVNVTANALGGALTYTIQLSPNQDFSSGVLEKSGARGQRFTGLSYGTRYFARVKTNLSPNFGKTTSFSTIPAEDLAFVTSPANGAIDLPPNLTVASNTVPGATSYTIELNTSLFFLASDAIIKTGNRTQSFTGLSYNKTYYSRVKTEFTQNWGETRSFTITDASKLSFITSPADGATGQPTTLNLICSQVPGATEFTVTIRSGDSPLVRVFTSNSRTIRVSGLDPNTLQHVQVRTNLSPLFGPIRTFTTGAALGALTAYPNPASNQVTIKNLKQGSSIKIVDALSGALVETFRATGEELTIETTKYRRGLYYVTQVNADGTEDESVRLVVN